MGQEDIWDTETAQSYDTEDRGMFAPDVLGPVVNRLAELAGNGRALEFAVGTGRVAIPLAEPLRDRTGRPRAALAAARERRRGLPQQRRLHRPGHLRRGQAAPD